MSPTSQASPAIASRAACQRCICACRSVAMGQRAPNRATAREEGRGLGAGMRGTLGGGGGVPRPSPTRPSRDAEPRGNSRCASCNCDGLAWAPFCLSDVQSPPWHMNVSKAITSFYFTIFGKWWHTDHDGALTLQPLHPSLFGCCQSYTFAISREGFPPHRVLALHGWQATRK